MSSEEEARVTIDALLTQAGWHVADANNVDVHAHGGVAFRENDNELL